MKIFKEKFLLPLAATVWLLWFYILTTTISTPHITYLRWLPPLETAFMNGDGNDKIAWQFVPLKKISPYLRQAVILAEDDQFFEHQGVDIDAVERAAKIDWKKKKFARGASTITMQLARNLYLSPHKSLLRKFRELLITLKLERELSKDRILELYLNVAEWGDGIYGAEAAARHYFGGSASGLGKHESAFLAAILPRPKFFDHHRNGPYLNRRVSVIESRL